MLSTAHTHKLDISPSLSNAYLFKIRKAQLFATPWTVACQAPLSMEFSRQEDWSGNPGLLSLLHWQADSLPLHHLESPQGKLTACLFFFLLSLPPSFSSFSLLLNIVQSLFLPLSLPFNSWEVLHSSEFSYASKEILKIYFINIYCRVFNIPSLPCCWKQRNLRDISRYLVFQKNRKELRKM